jgi:hypothetical protein
MARTEDLTVDQNTDFTFKLNLTDTNGDALDITNKSFAASMKKTYSDTTTIDFTTTIISAPGGSMSISLTSAQTGALDESIRYVYDVLMYEAGNTNITKVLDGKVFVKPSATEVGA